MTDIIDVIRTLILDSQELRPDPGVARRLPAQVVPGKATAYVGVRRSGKSTYLFQVMHKLMADSVARENILYVNFFDDRLHTLGQQGAGLVSEAYYSLYPDKKNQEMVYCFFDEIQVVPGWEAFVDRLMRTERCQIYLTGSSAHMLSREIATQMRGRALSWEIFPFSFQEFLDWKQVHFKGALSTKARLQVEKAWEEYWTSGGFPETLGLPAALRVKIHQEYSTAILFRDLVERHDVSHPKAVSDLAHWLADKCASSYSLNSLTGYLKSLGHKVPKMSVADYLEWLEDAYYFFTVRLFDASLARSNANPKKVYCIDHALVNSTSTGVLVNSGHLLENIAFLGLRRRYTDIYYYRTRSGREVDFVVPSDKGGRLLVQVCESLASPPARKREITALVEAMPELGVSRASIVTRRENEKVVVDGLTIDILPMWRFLLDLTPA